MKGRLTAPPVLAVGSGLLLIASFPPFDAGLLALVALVPLLLAIHDCAPRRALWFGCTSGFIAFLGILAWIRVFGLAPWILLSTYLAVFVGGFAAVYRWLAADRSATTSLWLAPLVWTGVEYVRSIGVFGFPWAQLGTTQHAVLPLVQIARVTGAFGVSFVVALAGATIAGMIISRRVVISLVPVLLLGAIVVWGRMAAEGGGIQHGRPDATGLLAAAVQPNVPQRVKFDPAYAAQHTRALQALVAEAGANGAELIVLPETALPGNIFGAAGRLDEVGRWARHARATVVASSLEDGTSNIAVAVVPSGIAVSRYDKVRLVAFGETGIRPGRRHEPLWTPVGRVGVAICFESIFPEVSRTLARNGAEVLAVITNDAWFDGTAGPAQHAAMAPFRAVETGRWVIRAANTGISMVIDPTGRVRAVAPSRQGAVLVQPVALRQSMTPYARWGDLFAGGVLVAVLVVAAPRLRAALAGDWRRPAFQQTVAVIVLPLIAVSVLLRATVSPWLWPAFLLAFVMVFSVLRSPRAWGVHRAGFVKTLLAGMVVVGGLWVLLATTLRSHGVPAALIPPEGGWAMAAGRQLVVAMAVEGWLRGLAFTSLSEWKGWKTAVAVTTVLGMMLQTGLPAESVAWALLTGSAFGMIRARTGNAVGLVIPHTIGNLLITVVATAR